MKRIAIVAGVVFLASLLATGEASSAGNSRRGWCQCPIYARQRRPDLRVIYADAWRWDNEARRLNFPVVTRLREGQEGAIVVFEPGVQGANPRYGHVAYVEAVHRDGTFDITEMGMGWRDARGNCLVHTRRNLSPGRGISFILRRSTPPTPTYTPTRTRTRTPTPTATATPTVAPVSSDLQLLQACLEQGYVCLPVPFEVTEPVTWYSGFETEGYRSEYLGFDLEPGMVVITPLDGLVHNISEFGFTLTVELPSSRELDLQFELSAYYEFEMLVQDGFRASAGEPLARLVREIQWSPGSGVGPDFEYPGMIRISTGYEGDYPNGMPVYPVVTWNYPQADETSVTDLMGIADCRVSTVHYPDEVAPYIVDLIHDAGVEVDHEPEGMFDLSPPLAHWPPEVGYGYFGEEQANSQTSEITGCLYMWLPDNPIEGTETIVFRSTAQGYYRAGEIKRFLVANPEP